MGLYLNQMFIRILNMSITAGCCIAAVLIIRLIFCKVPRKYLYALWLVVAFRLLCPVSVGTEFSMFNLENFLQSAPQAGMGSMEYFPQAGIEDMGYIPQAGPEEGHFLQAEEPDRMEDAAGLRTEGRSMTAPLPEAMVWAAGVLVFFLYFAAGMWHIKRKVKMAVLASPDSRVYECDGLTSPFTMGLFQPRIYLPFNLDGRSREMILLHEQYHIQRKDHVIKLLAFFLLSVYWFHPLVWAAWFCMCKDMEMSCDEKVLELLGEEHRKDYGMTLLAFASPDGHQNRMPLAFGEHDVKSRIKHTLHFKKPAWWVGIPAAAAVLTVLLIFGTNGISKEVNAAQLLYEARNPYIGDASANGRLLGAIAVAREDSVYAGLSFKTELQTSTEPYEFHFLLERDGERLRADEEEAKALDEDMQATAALMLALINNLGEVQWQYMLEGPDGTATDMVRHFDVQQAADRCRTDNIKEYGESPEKVQELLNLL